MLLLTVHSWKTQMISNRGYFEIGVYHPKTPMNVGTLWRSAYQLGAAGGSIVMYHRVFGI